MRHCKLRLLSFNSGLIFKMTYQDTLSQTLEDAASAILNLAQSNGVALPVSSYRVVWYEPVNDSSATLREEERQEPSFGAWWLEREQPSFWRQISSTPAVKEFLATAVGFAEREGKQIAFGPRRSGTDLAWQLLAIYFRRAGRYRVDHQTVSEVCTEFLGDLQGDNAVVLTLFLVEKFSAPREFALSNEVTFRRISDEDIGRLGRTHGMRLNTSWDIPGPSIPNRRDWICEGRQPSPKATMAVFNQHRELLEAVAGSLSLSVEGRATFTLMDQRWESPFLSSGTVWGGRAVYTSGTGASISLEPEGIQAFQANYQKIRQLGADTSFNHLQLPFRRLLLSASRPNNEDQLVDHVIALENLLANDTERLESTFRFRLRGAALLPDSFGNIRRRIDLMNKLYDLRSRIVHGNAGPEEVNEYLPQAEKALKAIFLWYLNHADTLGNSKAIVRRLDEALVAGGANWAYPSETVGGG